MSYSPTVENLLRQARHLSQEEQLLLLERLASLVRAHSTVEPPKERALGMHQGKMWMAEDFDDPLPDEFWLGKE